MIVYHISKDVTHDGVFEPRIPDNRMDNEDAESKRVCVSTSIAGCFTSMPMGASQLDVTNVEQKGYYKLFTIDTDKLGIPSSSIVTSQVLHEEDLVRDAEHTDEVWLLDGFTVPDEDQTLICLLDWQEESADIIPYNIYTLADEAYEGDYLTCYLEETDENVPCMTVITSVEYLLPQCDKGMSYTYAGEDGTYLASLVNTLPVTIDMDFWTEIIINDAVDMTDVWIKDALFND